MIKFLFSFFLISFSLNTFSQKQDSASNRMVVHSDYRLQLLGKRVSEINTSI
ncbi:hypothetical protein BH20BAC1_BH20BAC1_01760 [soil metagenome]